MREPFVLVSAPGAEREGLDTSDVDQLATFVGIWVLRTATLGLDAKLRLTAEQAFCLLPVLSAQYVVATINVSNAEIWAESEFAIPKHDPTFEFMIDERFHRGEGRALWRSR